MNENVTNGLTCMSSFTTTHKEGVEAMVYGPNVGGTQINPNLATCHNNNNKNSNGRIYKSKEEYSRLSIKEQVQAKFLKRESDTARH